MQTDTVSIAPWGDRDRGTWAVVMTGGNTQERTSLGTSARGERRIPTPPRDRLAERMRIPAACLPARPMEGRASRPSLCFPSGNTR